jgi:hypothetical protein
MRRVANVVHTFTNCETSEVYDETQTNDAIKMGDALVVPNERIVGFLLGAWPVAVTIEHGAFHQKTPGFSWGGLQRPEDEVDYAKAAAFAIHIAKGLGYPINN